EAAARAHAAGLRVLQGGCRQRGGQDPYAPLTAAVERRIQRLSREALRTGLAGCAWLVRLLPELADGPIEALPNWSVSPAQERRLLFGAVARFLANVAGTSGTLLVLDDLQWAGADALDLLAALVRSARSAGQTRVRVAGAYRDVEVTPQHPLAGMVAQRARGGLLAQTRVAPLTEGEAADLLD